MHSPSHLPNGTLEERLAGLSPDKRALLIRRLASGRTAAGPDAIGPRADRGPAPLSPAQELLWLVQQLSPDANAYHATAARRLTGELDEEALRQALRTIVGRHESLRTTIATIDGAPVQVVHDGAAPGLQVIDAPGMTEARQLALLRDLVRQPFELSALPLFRATLIRLASREHLLLFVTHHIIWDGWSKGVLFRELGEFYADHLAGRAPSRPAPRVQYADYAAWQRDRPRAERARRQLAYWREQLAGVPSLLDFPTDHPRPAVQGHRGDRVMLRVPPDTLEALRAVAAGQRCTLFMALAATWVVLLHRYTGSADITVGTPIAGRNQVEVEDVIGYFTNTLALRVDCAGDPSFRALLDRVRETALGAYANQDVPLEQVLRAVLPRRDLSHTPLFQSLVVLQNASQRDLELPGLTAESLSSDPGTAKFDLSLAMGEFDGELRVSLEYRTDLFEPATARRIAGHLGALLAAVARDPARPLSALPMLTVAERAWLGETAAGPRGPLPDATLPELVRQAAVTHAASVALEAEDGPVSYAELDRRVVSMAARLRAHGIRPGTAVGLLAGRGPDTVIALLAVLHAGAACVPLDPALPDERLVFLVRDAGVALTLAARPELLRARTLGAPAADLSDPEAALPRVTAPATVPAGTAFVLYTSGSTGLPKGVPLGHRGLVNHALAASRVYQLGPADRVLQFASPGFDISIEETFCGLLSGATLVPRSEGMPLAGAGLLEWLAESRITVLDLPTAFWHGWVRDLERAGARPPECLRLVIVGGEQASAAALASWRALTGGAVRWLNTYGPTETSVIATWHEPPADWVPEPGREIPIGRPLDNVAVHLLDARQAAVPIGVTGELYIAGPGVAPGYLGQPELTAQRFVRLADGARAYRTGDLARRLADGTLEFLGRADRQLKLRGFRIEPAEVEAALRRDHRVTGALAVLREIGGGPALVGYVTTREPAGPGLAADLRRLLAATLPSYAVPSAVLPLPAFPLTHNGKIDHDALPAPEPASRSAGRAPAGELETAIAEIWGDLLGHPVGATDDFFDLGGHSMHAAQMAARLEQRLGTRIPLATLLRAPTVAGLAEEIGALGEPPSAPSIGVRPAAGAGPVVRLRPGAADRAPLVLLADLGGELLCYRDLLRHLPDQVPVLGLGSGERAGASIEDQARHHVEALLHAQPSGPYRLAGWSFGGVVGYEMARLLRERGAPVAFVGLIDAALPAPDRGLARPAPPARTPGEANAAALRAYRPRPYPGQVTVFRALAAPGSAPADDPRLAWAVVADGAVVRDIVSPGVSHRSLLAEPHVRMLAEAVADALSG